jgi:hypothetical protein
MLLSNADIELLGKTSHSHEEFSYIDKHGFRRLRNIKGICFFYDTLEKRCRAYKFRPLGCRIYPVIYSEAEGVIVDWICPMKDTISTREIKTKTKKLTDLLQTIDAEAKMRRQDK